MMDVYKDKKTSPNFFSLGREKFSFKFLFRYGFYRVIWFGIVAKFGIVSVNKKAVIRKLNPIEAFALICQKHYIELELKTADLINESREDMDEFKRFRAAETAKQKGISSQEIADILSDYNSQKPVDFTKIGTDSISEELLFIESINAMAVHVSYGTSEPLQYLIYDGYDYELIGYIFYEPIIEYTKFINTKKLCSDQKI